MVRAVPVRARLRAQEVWNDIVPDLLTFYAGCLPFYGRSLGESYGLFISVLLSFHVRNLPARPQNALKYGFIKLNTLNKCRNRTLSLKKYSLILDNRKISINFAPFLIAKNCFIILIY